MTLTIVISVSALILGFVASYFVWQLALRNRSRKILTEAETESEVIKKEKILQAKERFLQLKMDHEKMINDRNASVTQRENNLKQKG